MKVIEKGLTQQPWTHETVCDNCGARLVVEKQDLFFDEDSNPEWRDEKLVSYACVECMHVGNINASISPMLLCYARLNKKTISQLLEQILERLYDSKNKGIAQP